MKIDRNQIVHVAKLARLSLSGNEMEEFTNQLSGIIDYVEKINSLDTDSVDPADHIAELKNVFRKDEVRPSLTTEELEKIAPAFEKGHIVVPKVIEGA
jgi:aspartyl-tRNA(Asn)/glutamyl-tRNA(Gln) amidotransferase subunit C